MGKHFYSKPPRLHRLLRLRTVKVVRKPKTQTDFKPSNWLLYAAMLALALFTIGTLTAIALLHG